MWRGIAAEHRFRFRLNTLVFLTLIVSAFQVYAQEPTWERLINSDREPQNWMSYGGNYAAHRFSSLDQINRDNVKQLAPVWMFHTGERKWRYNTTGINVASLLATGGDLIFSGDAMGSAFALDARTGQKLWSFNTGAGMSGSPISYSVNGRQYIAIPTGMGSLLGDLEAGRALFFDSAETHNCRVCHTVQNRGGRVGPDLTGLAGKSPREILRSIVAPHAAIEERYATITITTRAGEKFTGVKRDENETTIRIYDTSTLPPVSRAVLKSDAVKIERLNTSAMPADYASKYSLKQLLDLISFLKSSNVSLKELF